MSPGGIRTLKPSRRAAVEPLLRPRGHKDRLLPYILLTHRGKQSYISWANLRRFDTAYTASQVTGCVQNTQLFVICTAVWPQETSNNHELLTRLRWCTKDVRISTSFGVAKRRLLCASGPWDFENIYMAHPTIDQTPYMDLLTYLLTYLLHGAESFLSG